MEKINKIVQVTLMMSALVSGAAQAQGKIVLGYTNPNGLYTEVTPEESPLAFDQVLKNDKEGFRVTTADGLHTVIRTDVESVIELPPVENQLGPMELRLRKNSIVRIDFTEGRLSIRNLHDEKNGSVVVAFVGGVKGSRIPLGSVGIFDAQGARYETLMPEIVRVDDEKTMKKYLKDIAILYSMGFYK